MPACGNCESCTVQDIGAAIRYMADPPGDPAKR